METEKKRWSIPREWPIVLVKGKNGYEVHILYGSTHIPVSDETGKKLEKEITEYWKKKYPRG